jgi:nucleoside phosphorylase
MQILEEEPKKKHKPNMIISAGEIENFSFATPIGIGLTSATLNLTKLVLTNMPKSLIFVGSCGSYGKYQIGDIVQSTTASNIEFSYWDNSSYTPIDNVIDAKYNKLVKSQTIVNSSNYITTNPKYNNNYLSNNIGLENMEFFAVLEVAKEFNIEVGGIFVVTNFIDKNAHKEFKNNHENAINKLTQYIKDRQKEFYGVA